MSQRRLKKICSHPNHLIQQAMTRDVKWIAVTLSTLLAMPPHQTDHMSTKLIQLLPQ
jgi:hypothetical protein